MSEVVAQLDVPQNRSSILMKILVTNDDGIDARGIQVLASVAREFGHITVVAPKLHYSGCSHQMTFEGHLDAHNIGDGQFWIDGFPADCVRIGLAHLCPDVDLVVSGVNHGANLGLDNYLSGTVAAAREATFFGLPSIALSQYHRGLTDESWAQSKIMARRVLQHLLDGRIQPGHYWNVNFPNLDRDADAETICMSECEMDRTPLPNDYVPNELGFLYEGDYHGRNFRPDTDVDRCMRGEITMTLFQTGPASVPSDTRTSATKS